MKHQIFPLIACAALAACTLPASPSDGPAPPANETTPYRALGTEPGWSLVINDREMIYDGEYGAVKISVAKPEGRASFNGWRYVTDRLSVDITHAECSDGMSDRRYADTVSVLADGRKATGCGGTILPPQDLAGTRWQFVSVDGVAAVQDRNTRLEFDGRHLSGSIGCNGFSGPYSVGKGILKVGNVIATQMGCMGIAGEHERILFGVLGPATSLRFTPDGRMLLSNGEHTIVLRQVI